MELQKYAGKLGTGNFRPMTFTEAQSLRSGSHCWFLASDGSARECKVNGKPKRWKRDACRIEIPVKYGLYEYARFTETDIAHGHLLIEL